MCGDLLWPDLDLEPSLVSNIYPISTLSFILGVFGASFGPKLTSLRSLRLVTWKPRCLPLTWPWPDTWPHLENLGGALGSSHRELWNTARRSSLRSHSFASYDVGAFNTPPPSASRGWRNTQQPCRDNGYTEVAGPSMATITRLGWNRGPLYSGMQLMLIDGVVIV